MKKKSFTHVNKLLRTLNNHSAFLKNKWQVLLLALILVSGCKKITEEPGIVGVCPVVVSTDPLDKAVDIALDKTISATFNTDMNPVSITGTSFILKQGSTYISGTVAPTASGMTFTLKPDVSLLPFTIYTGIITTDAKDKFNTAMVSNYVWTFTTIPKLTLSSSPIAGGTTVGAGLFAQGATVTVTATPASGYSFVNWTDSASGVIASVSPGYQFVMAGNRALVAHFSLIPPAQFAVILSSNPAAGGTTFGSGAYNTGTSVTVIESPNPGYTFANWTENGNIISTSSSYQFIITANRTLVANFTAIPALQFAVFLSSSPSVGGTTTGAGSFTTGTSVTIGATPNAGYTFVNWTEGATVISTSSSYTFVVTANRTLVANFTAIPALQFAVFLSSSPSIGGTTTGAGSYTTGTSITIGATPNAGYTFVNWTEGATVISTSSSYTFVVTANRTLVANFVNNTYTLTLSANPVGGGSVLKTPNQAIYNSGTLVTASTTANAGYTFVNWTEGVNIVSTNAVYTFLLNANRVLVANYILNDYTLTVTTFPAVGGSVVKNPNQGTYTSGTSVILTATANSGYVFSSWSGDATGSVNPLTIVMNSNKNITANFTAVPVIIIGTAGNFGSFGGAAGITNQGLNTIINNGGIGTTAASTLITGFHSGLTGDIYTETPLNVGNSTGGIFTAPPFPGTAASFLIAQQALADANVAYISISPASKPGGIDPGAGELGGLTLAPGIYKSASGTFNISNGNLTLDAQGNPNAVWIFQTAAGLTVGIAGPTGAKSVIMINGGLPKNVFWYVGSAATINAAGGGIMTGTIIATSGVTFSTAGNAAQTVLNGRAISLVASVTMVNTTINNQ